MENPLTYENLNGTHTIAIYGDIGSGKTSLAYSLLDLFKKNKSIYFVKHPKPDWIESLGFKNMYSLEQLERIEDAVIYIDEPQLWLSIYDKKANLMIAKICSLARQKGIVIIISSSDTRVFTKHNEAYFDLWCIKDVNYPMVKNGSIIKNAIKNIATLDPEGVRLDNNEFVISCRKKPDLDGRHSFTEVPYFTEALSKPYRLWEKSEKKKQPR